MRALLYAPGAENVCVPSVFLALGNASLHAKGLPPVRHADLLPGEHQFSGGCKAKQACKITLQAFANTFPITRNTEPTSKSGSLTGCIYVSKPGTSRKPPSAAKLLCWSLAQVWLGPAIVFPGSRYRPQAAPGGSLDMVPLLGTVGKKV